MRNASRKSPVTTSESESVPATSHWSFANVTEKTVAKNRPSRKGARSATARGRSRAIVAMSRHGRSARRLDLEPGVEAGPTSLGGRARTLGIGRDAVVEHLPASAALQPHRGVDVAHGPHALEQALGRCGCVATAKDEVEGLGRPQRCKPDAVVARREPHPVRADHERVADERDGDDRSRRNTYPCRRQGSSPFLQTDERRRGTATAARKTIDPVYRTIGLPDSSAVIARSGKPTVDQTPPAKSPTATSPTYAAKRLSPQTAAAASAIVTTRGMTDHRALE